MYALDNVDNSERPLSLQRQSRQESVSYTASLSLLCCPSSLFHFYSSVSQEITKKQEERDAALARYETKKRKQHRKLSKRNYKGQPILSAQMDILLEKIQSQQKT